MRRTTQSLLRRLLAGSESLSPPEKEEVLENILRQLPPPRRTTWLGRPAVRWALMAAAAAAVLILFFRPPAEPEFLARGAASPELMVTCIRDGAPSDCRIGSRLLFKLRPGGARYFSALAFGPERTLWYFNNVDLAQLPVGGVLEQAVTLGPEHGKGTFEVVGLFSSQPLEKSQVRELLEGPPPHAQDATVIVREQLVVGR